jgi:hypothetical protein
MWDADACGSGTGEATARMVFNVALFLPQAHFVIEGA